jgi:hypothetical protein
VCYAEVSADGGLPGAGDRDLGGQRGVGPLGEQRRHGVGDQPCVMAKVLTRDKGSHFAAFEQPAIFVDEVRAAFRAFRTG